MFVRLKQIREFLIGSPKNGDVMTYNSTSGKWVNTPAPPKIWTGQTTVTSSGQFSISFPVGFFTSTPMVFAQARSKGTATGDQNFASVRTITATGCSGIASNSLTSRLSSVYVLTFAANGTVIDIVAIGN